MIAGVVTMNADTTVTASFTQDQYAADHRQCPRPGDQVSGSGAYTYGTPVTLTLGTVESGWTFTGWSGNVIAGVVTMNADTTVTASFTQDQYALTIVSAHAPVTKSPDQEPTPTAPGHPHPRHRRVRLDLHRLEWQPDRGVVTMNGNTNVTATFNQDQYALTVVSAHAPVTKTPDQSPTPTARCSSASAPSRPAGPSPAGVPA